MRLYLWALWTVAAAALAGCAGAVDMTGAYWAGNSAVHEGAADRGWPDWTASNAVTVAIGPATATSKKAEHVRLLWDWTGLYGYMLGLTQPDVTVSREDTAGRTHKVAIGDGLVFSQRFWSVMARQLEKLEKQKRPTTRPAGSPYALPEDVMRPLTRGMTVSLARQLAERRFGVGVGAMPVPAIGIGEAGVQWRRLPDHQFRSRSLGRVHADRYAWEFWVSWKALGCREPPREPVSIEVPGAWWKHRRRLVLPPRSGPGQRSALAGSEGQISAPSP